MVVMTNASILTKTKIINKIKLIIKDILTIDLNAMHFHSNI